MTPKEEYKYLSDYQFSLAAGAMFYSQITGKPMNYPQLVPAHQFVIDFVTDNVDTIEVQNLQEELNAGTKVYFTSTKKDGVEYDVFYKRRIEE